MLPWITFTALGIAGAILYYFLRRRRQEEKAVGTGQGQECSASGGQGEQTEAARQAETAGDQERKEQKVREVLEGDPRIAKHFLKRAGVGPHREPKEAARDQELVREMARKIPETEIEVLRIASSQKDIDFDLKKQTRRVPVSHPTGDIEPEQMNDLSQLPTVLPEQLMQEDDQFYDQLAREQLTVFQAYESIVDKKLLYILLDASGSMEELMRNGLPRHVWARGVTLNLLLKAADGEAKYFFRPFTETPHGLHRACTPGEAEKLIDVILNTSFSNGGTNIFAAFSQAVSDIRTSGEEIRNAEILIITDGQDHSMDDIDAVKKILGNDVRLHVAMIGRESEALKQAASSYHVFN